MAYTKMVYGNFTYAEALEKARTASMPDSLFRLLTIHELEKLKPALNLSEGGFYWSSTKAPLSSSKDEESGQKPHRYVYGEEQTISDLGDVSKYNKNAKLAGATQKTNTNIWVKPEDVKGCVILIQAA